nr:PREDICTED: uncharacterized protein LOC109037681 [Bemisia tabaci]
MRGSIAVSGALLVFSLFLICGEAKRKCPIVAKVWKVTITQTCDSHCKARYGTVELPEEGEIPVTNGRCLFWICWCVANKKLNLSKKEKAFFIASGLIKQKRKLVNAIKSRRGVKLRVLRSSRSRSGSGASKDGTFVLAEEFPGGTSSDTKDDAVKKAQKLLKESSTSNGHVKNSENPQAVLERAASSGGSQSPAHLERSPSSGATPPAKHLEDAQSMQSSVSRLETAPTPAQTETALPRSGSRSGPKHGDFVVHNHVHLEGYAEPPVLNRLLGCKMKSNPEADPECNRRCVKEWGKYEYPIKENKMIKGIETEVVRQIILPIASGRCNKVRLCVCSVHEDMHQKLINWNGGPEIEGHSYWVCEKINKLYRPLLGSGRNICLVVNETDFRRKKRWGLF